MLLFLAATMSLGLFTGCSDDEDLAKADALFRPILSDDNIETGLTEENIPYVTLKWDKYASASEYEVTIEANDGSDTRSIVTDTTFCRFDELSYDKEYNVRIKSRNKATGLESKDYVKTVTTADYPTALSNITAGNVIDTQVRVRWNGGADFNVLRIYKDDDNELVAEMAIDEETLAAGNVVFRNLEPRTDYRVEAYVDDAYKGKKRFTTTSPESYTGVVYDLRSLDASESKGKINTDWLAEIVGANPGEEITIVLQGGTLYKISGGTKIPATTGKIKFVTGLSLAGNALFVSGGGFSLDAGGDVETLRFEKIDFISDKFSDDPVGLIAANTDKGFGGRQVFNINGVKATLKNLIFKNCSITGYRAVVRGQSDGDNITNITMDGCLVNGIGDQGVFTTTNKKGDWQSIKMKNCTVTNIVMLCDFRSTTGQMTMDIENCNFCYAPLETTANANTPLFRFGDNPVILNVKKCYFGPSMATKDSGGGAVSTFTAGVAGSIFLNGANATIDVNNSYKTNFGWTDLGTEDAPKIYPLEGLLELGMSETDFWMAPTEGNFTIKAKAPDSSVGDERW